MKKDSPSRDIEILVVEDSPTQAEELRFILEKRDFNVSVSSNGKTALAFLERHKPDVVITDIIMPEMDGYELCRRMASDPDLAGIPVILVTALTEPTNVLRGLEVGANNFITKPYDEAHLVSRIQYLMANRGLREKVEPGSGINVLLSGQTYHITADRPQILDLLLSTYENAQRQNRELLRMQLELMELNERLEETVSERDAEIVERKRIEEELQNTHDGLERRVEERTAEVKRLADLLDLTHDTIFVRDMEDRITYWNRGAEETYGWSLKEALGKAPRVLLHTRFSDSYKSMKTALMREDRWEGELVHTKRDGSEIVVASRQVLRRDRDGKALDVLEINIDITAQKKAEAQLRQAQKMEALGTLTGGIAHDFNNILAAILGFAEMSLDDVPKGTVLEKGLRNILISSFRARDLIRQMLTFSRKTEYEKQAMPLTPIVKETAKLLRASIPATIEIDVHITATSDTVIANATGIQQVVINLCTNAAYAMKEQGGKLTITLSDSNKYVELAITDTGIGMNAEVQKRVFEPFFTTKEVGEGTGMGLSVVYGIVKSLNGDITVDSKPGAGSVFRVLLPKAEMDDAPEIAQLQTAQGGKERILFIDDEPLIVELGKGMLERLGYTVTGYTTGKGALEAVSENPERFDLVITDQTMPELTGMRLAKRLLEIRPSVPIILCTGHSDSVNQESAMAAGIKEFLMKPLAKLELAAAVRRALDAKTEVEL